MACAHCAALSYSELCRVRIGAHQNLIRTTHGPIRPCFIWFVSLNFDFLNFDFLRRFFFGSWS